MVRDQFVTAAQTEQCAGAFELALGKKTYDFTGCDLFRRGANRGTGMARLDRDAAHDTQERPQKRLVIKFPVDDVTNRTRTSELQHDRIDPGDVIGQK